MGLYKETLLRTDVKKYNIAIKILQNYYSYSYYLRARDSFEKTRVNVKFCLTVRSCYSKILPCVQAKNNQHKAIYTFNSTKGRQILRQSKIGATRFMFKQLSALYCCRLLTE